jgi:hypothetical protein
MMTTLNDESDDSNSNIDLTVTVKQLEATPQQIDKLQSAGVLNNESRQAALAMINGPLVWWPWVEKALLFLGLALTLSGVVCFFAWNWDALPGLVKLAIVQVGIVGCCAVAWQKTLEVLSGKAAITAAAVLVGVFLAVFGQVYQTGADAYQLFVGWALLILPWVVMCRLAGLWVLWLAIVNIGVSLYWEQAIEPRGIDTEWLPVALGLINGLAAVIREVLVHRGCNWLPVWTRRLFVPAALTALTVPGFIIVANFNDASAGAWCGLIILLASLAVLYWQFRLRTPDLFVLTCGATTVTVLSGAVVIRILMEVGDEAIAFFFSGLAILGLVALMTRWLMRTGRELRADANSKSHSTAITNMDNVTAAVPSDENPRDSRSLSVNQLLTRLSEQGHLSEDGLQTAYGTLEADQQDDSTPWFVHALTGFGAWLACLLFLGALAIAGMFEEGLSSVAVGVFLMIGGALLDRRTESEFPRQLGLAAGLTGLGLTGIGIAQDSHSSGLSSLTFSMALATAVFYRAFRCDQFRFLSCLITVICATVWLGEDMRWSGEPNDSFEWAIHVLVLLETRGIGLVFARTQRQLLLPAGYAMAVGLLGTLLVTQHAFGSQHASGLHAWPSAAILALAQIWLLRRAWGTDSADWKNGLGVAAGGTALLGILSLPGVLAAIGMTILGHLERDAVLKRLGILFLPLYIARFYYNLETTLLFKSLVLIGSGVVLWAVRWYFRLQVEKSNLTATETQS